MLCCDLEFIGYCGLGCCWGVVVGDVWLCGVGCGLVGCLLCCAWVDLL